jgi:hypothetical protein
MSGKLPPAPQDDDDRERAWIVEGLRQALARAQADELTSLTSLLEPVADGEGNVAGWLVMLLADEMGRKVVTAADAVAADAVAADAVAADAVAADAVAADAVAAGESSDGGGVATVLPLSARHRPGRPVALVA